MSWFSGLFGASAPPASTPPVIPASETPAAATPAPGVDMAKLQAALFQTAPRLDFSTWQGPLQAAFQKFEIFTPREVAAAMGQFLVEAGADFSGMVEDLTYTSPTRIIAIFPREVPNLAGAAPYVRNPVALGNLVYANRNGNGDVASGDGFRFRGRGLISITGRTAYTALAAALGMNLDDLPVYCETPAGAALCGCWWLVQNGYRPLANAWNIAAITRLVNGPAMQNAEVRLAYSNNVLAGLD